MPMSIDLDLKIKR